MARVTIEDCAKRIQNRFELCMIATQRVKEMNSGSPSTLPDLDPTDKLSVVALKEIAAGILNHNILKEMLIKNMRPISHLDEPLDSSSSNQTDLNQVEDFNIEIQEESLFTGDEDGFEQINYTDEENTLEDDIIEDDK